MKRAVILALLVASSVAMADDADVDQTPVTVITPAQTTWTLSPISAGLVAALAAPAPSPARIEAAVAQLTPAQIASVLAAVAAKPASLSALVAQLNPGQIARVVAALQGNPAAISALVAQLDPAKLNQVSIAMFLADVDGWQRVGSFLNPSPAAPPKKFGGNWLDAGRARIQKEIDRDGYTPEHLSEAISLMQKASGQ
jgi:hypothetical protein